MVYWKFVISLFWWKWIKRKCPHFCTFCPYMEDCLPEMYDYFIK